MMLINKIFSCLIFIALAFGFSSVYGIEIYQLNSSGQVKIDAARQVNLLPKNERINSIVTDTSKIYIYSLELKWEDQENIDQMLSTIEDSWQHGLTPEDYHLSEIKNMLEQENRLALDAKMASSLDSLLTDAFFRLAGHLATGKTNPDENGLQWAAKRRELNVDIG